MKSRLNDLILKHFHGVLSVDSKSTQITIDNDSGVVVPADGTYALADINKWKSRRELNGNDLNKTFHKSWNKIKSSSRFDLYVHQIRHYISVFDGNGSDEIYIPAEVCDVPDVKLKYFVIKTYSKQGVIEMALDLFKSGVALAQETIDELFEVLEMLKYTFTGKEGIKNKEVLTILMDKYGIYPDEPVEILRYVVFKATGKTLLIKSRASVLAIKCSDYDPTRAFNAIGLERMAEIFNRFKPLFLAFKRKSDTIDGCKLDSVINKISRLSKTKHKPLVKNPMNNVTSALLTEKDLHWVENATNFALLKALGILHNRIGGQTNFVYKIRNGKSWVNTQSDIVSKRDKSMWESNFGSIVSVLKSRLDFKGKTFLIPKGIEYGLPTSEKLFVGNIPFGTRFIAKRIVAGLYWENDGDNRVDLDVSTIDINGAKVGWNDKFTRDDTYFSGDMIDGKDGAVEFHLFDGMVTTPKLIKNNVFRGESNHPYRVIIGKGDKIERVSNYMLDPNNRWIDIASNSVDKETIIGFITPAKKDKNAFVVLNIGTGNARISDGKYANETALALWEEYQDGLTFNKLIELLGGTVVTKKSKVKNVESETPIELIDLSIDILQKDTLINLVK